MKIARWSVLVVLVVALNLSACVPRPTPRPPLPPGTSLPHAAGETPWLSDTVLSGFFLPTNVEFASNGRVWVSQKDGEIFTFDTIDDSTPTLAADISSQVRSWGDHGILGLAIDPQFPARPYIYVAHATDPTGKWGDGCPSPPGSGVDGCVGGARVVRLTLGVDGVATGEQRTLAENRWCYQYSSHAVGDLTFLPDGTLLSSSGEGGFWADTDYGQKGGTWGSPPNFTPKNPCGDPTGNVPGPSPTQGEGGAFRAQDLLTPGDPQGWNGAIVRLDPDTGAPAPGNPLIGGATADDDHIIAHGLRNPYRYTVDPNTGDVLVADVGWGDYEEIDRLDPSGTTVPNFGWPCEEGPYNQVAYSSLRNHMCDLARSPSSPTRLTGPWAAFWHGGHGAALSGISVVTSGRYDPRFDGQIVFSDYVEQAVYAMPQGSRDHGNPAEATMVAEGVVSSELQRAPDGYIYVVDVESGTISRLQERSELAIASIDASAIDGPVPLSVTLDGSGSNNPTSDPLDYSWDLDGDGQYDDATGPSAATTFTSASNATVGLRVQASNGSVDTDSVTVYPGNTPPAVDATITSPMPWTAGRAIDFTVSGTDAEDGVLGAPSLSWTTQLQHCYHGDDCHLHPLGDGTGSTGSVEGPGHEYPSYVLLTYSAVDSRGETTTVSEQLQPAVATLQVTSGPAQAQVVVGSTIYTTPAQIPFIAGTTVTVSAVSPQVIGNFNHVFGFWSDSGAKTHAVNVSRDMTLKVTMVLG